MTSVMQACLMVSGLSMDRLFTKLWVGRPLTSTDVYRPGNMDRYHFAVFANVYRCLSCWLSVWLSDRYSYAGRYAVYKI